MADQPLIDSLRHLVNARAHPNDRRRMAVLHAQQYHDPDEQLQFWASLACGLLLLHRFGDDEIRAAFKMAHDTVHKFSKEDSSNGTRESG